MRTASLLAVALLFVAAFLSSQNLAAAAAVPVSYEIMMRHARLHTALGRRALQRRAPQKADADNKGNKNKKSDNEDSQNKNKNKGGKPQNGKGNDAPGNAPGNADAKPDADKDASDPAAGNPTAAVPAGGSSGGSSGGSAGGSRNDSTVSGGPSDSSLYNSTPSNGSKGGDNGGKMVGVGAGIGCVLVVGAGVLAFKIKQKKDEQTEAIVAKSATAFVQQTNSMYEQQISSIDEQSEEVQAIGTYTVVASFIPNMSDELDIQPGDKITVLVEYDDGWVQGINETRDRRKGVLPRYCLDDMNNVNFSVGKRTSSIGGFTSVTLS